MMWNTKEGSTGRLVQLCLGYFIFYVITGLTVKYFLNIEKMSGLVFLTYSTLGGTGICLGVVLIAGWYRFKSHETTTLLGQSFPREFLYIVPSGICTAVIIPTTTLMYTLPITVMVAMVMMRGSVIVTSRIIDFIQIRQGILKKTVYWEENVAVCIAILVVLIQMTWTPSNVNAVADWLVGAGLSFADALHLEDKGKNYFDFLENTAAVAIFSSYITAYAIRIYIMNYYKNTRDGTKKQDNKGFFAIEQIAASLTLSLVLAFIVFGVGIFGERKIVYTIEAIQPVVVTEAGPPETGPVPLTLRLDTLSVDAYSARKEVEFIWETPQLELSRRSVTELHQRWGWALLAGSAFGVVAFFSVFIFMFKGRTATFAGLVNRLTSLVAGTTATLIFYYSFDGRPVKPQDWVSLVGIMIAMVFLARAERKRAAELE